MASIVSRKPKGCSRPVYYYHHTYRVEVDPHKTGKGPGSGPSKVKSEDVYLGTADEILDMVKGDDGYVRADHKAFGLPLAVLSTLEELGVRETVNARFPKRRQGMTSGDYLVMDKGSNSKKNVEAVSSAGMDLVWSLVPSQCKELMSQGLGSLNLKIGDPLAHETRTVVWGVLVKVVVTYNESLARRQRRGSEKSVGTLETALRESFENHWKRTKPLIEQALSSV